jgi:hypothetical protein
MGHQGLVALRAADLCVVFLREQRLEVAAVVERVGKEAADLFG